MNRKIATLSPLFALGFLSIGFQIYLLREFFIVFRGQELITGLAFSCWLILTGLGAWAGRLMADPPLRKMRGSGLLTLLGVMPVLLILLLNTLGTQWLLSGIVPRISQIIGIILIIQAPFCLLNGWLFSMFSSSEKTIRIAGCFAIESMGSVLAGIWMNFFLLWVFSSHTGLLIVCIGYFLILVPLQIRASSRPVLNGMLLVLIIGSLSWIHWHLLPDLDRQNYPGQQLIDRQETPYGQLTVTTSPGQLNFFGNGLLLFSTGNDAASEESVHYATVQHPHPRNVLLISGGFSGAIRELLKYSPQRIDYLETDPSLLRILSCFTAYSAHRSVNIHPEDARTFLKKTSVKYDVVLINMPPPSTLRFNGFYTQEFIRSAKKCLNPGAVISWNLPASGDYQNENERQLTSLIFNTLKQEFDHVIIFPGLRNFFIASDRDLTLNVPSLIEKKNVNTIYVNKYYIDFERIKERAALLTPDPAQEKESNPFAGTDKRINRDFFPVAVFASLNIWFDYMNMDSRLILLAFIFVTGMIMLTLNPFSAGVFTGGMTVATSEILVIFGLQIIFGNMFLLLSAAIAIFMLGLAIGSSLPVPDVWTNRKGLITLQWMMALSAGLVTMLIYLSDQIVAPAPLIYSLLSCVSLLVSVIGGLEYRVAASLSGKSRQATVSSVYSADLFGAAAGVFIVNLLLLPFFGLILTGISMVAVNLISALYTQRKISS